MKKLDKLQKDYLKYCKTIKKLDPKTLKAYQIDLTQFQTFVLTQSDFTDKSTINEFISSLHEKYQPKTTKRKIAALKAFFRYLIYEELISSNPFDKISVKFREPVILPRTIPEPIIEDLLSAMYHCRSQSRTEYQRNSVLRDIAVIESLFATGVRISELCSLRLQQVDLVSFRITIYGKGSKERMIQITNPDVKKILLEYYSAFKMDIASTGWFFINRLHQRLSEQSVRSMIVKYLKLAMVDMHITPHMFRHSLCQAHDKK